jgi:hypothetical protein
MAEYSLVSGSPEANGFAYRAGFNFSPLNNLIVDVSAMGHDEYFGANPEIVSAVRAKIAYEIKMGKYVGIAPEVNFQKRLGHTIEGGGLTQDEFWWGLTLKFYF